jgi:hypothetical protein
VVGTGNPAGQLRRAQPSCELQQPQGIPAGLRHDPVTDVLVEMTGNRRTQQGAGVLVREPFDTEHRQRGKGPLVGGLANREEQRDGLGQEPPSDEPQHLGRRLVQPLGVVHETHQRPVGG